MLLGRPAPLLRRLRAWRRTRPFWGGLLLVLGGAELLLVPLSPVTVLVSLGPGGIAAIGIGAALIVAGLFLWCVPQARAYVSLHALLLSVLSFVATNLGGFLVGMLLGIAGSALAFGWTPVTAAAETAGGEADGPAPEGRGSRALAATLPVVLLAALGTGAPPARGRGGGRAAPPPPPPAGGGGAPGPPPPVAPPGV
ncbi:DUF6114 domain-containing protein, partial [Streptomyces lavendulae]|uniref:DUF6114 domain-containing protein n=1 Tax=Streptomyces lavendulae TaxID=1914 RepID=UPI0036CFD9B3